MKALRISQISSSSKSSPPSPRPSSSTSSSRIHLRSVLFVVTCSNSSPASSARGGLKSPWHRRKRKHILSAEQWRNLFTPDGRLRDNGIKFLKKVRTGGVDPSIRPEVWPFLLGVFELTSSKQERDVLITMKRKEYEKLRRQCRQLIKDNSQMLGLNESGPKTSGDRSPSEGTDSLDSECVPGARVSVSSEDPASSMMDRCSESKQDSNVASGSDSTDSDLSDDPETSQTFDMTESTEDNNYVSQSKQDSPTSKMDVQSESCNREDSAESTVDDDHGSQPKQDSPTSKMEVQSESCYREDSTIQTFDIAESTEDNDHGSQANQDSLTSKMEVQSVSHRREDFATWQRIIRLDAVRANGEWMEYNPAQAAVSDAEACHAAEVVRLTGYEHLDSGRIFHASRLVAILEAYALYDPEIGYCQGMSDLLSPIIAVITEDHEAFWCFVGFMKKARHNFRLDEVGIRRQLNLVSKIIKHKDTHLYRHLEKLEAEDCFFVYRMVVVLFRRELTFEQTLCLWEVMWADQAALRAGVGKSAWDRIRQRAPPTEDLLLYAIAASVLQRRKQIIEKYSSMDEILRECNAMAGHLDVWKLLDDAHGLVVMLNDKIETPL